MHSGPVLPISGLFREDRSCDGEWAKRKKTIKSVRADKKVLDNLETDISKI